MAPDPILDQLRLMRVRSGLRKYELADRMGVNPASVSHWDLGRREPKLATLRAYADLFGYELALIPKFAVRALDPEQRTGEQR